MPCSGSKPALDASLGVQASLTFMILRHLTCHVVLLISQEVWEAKNGFHDTRTG